MIYKQKTDFKSLADWVYERSQNIFWTISGQYDVNLPKAGLGQDMVRSKHGAILWGGIRLYMDADLVEDFLSHLQAKPDFYDIFSRILWLALEEYCMPRLGRDRPAIKEICLDYYQVMALLRPEEAGQTGADILERAYYSEKLGNLSPDNRWLKDLVGDIITKAGQAEDTAELITGIEEIFRLYFVTESWLHQITGQTEKTSPGKGQPGKYKPAEAFMEAKKRKPAPQEVDVEKIVDAEFNPNSYRGKASAEYLEAERQRASKLANPFTKTKQSDFDKVRLFFGDPLYPQAEIDKIEQKISLGIHHHKKIYITAGKFSDLGSDYQVRFLEEQRHFNLEYYELHYRACRRHIQNLRALIMQALLPDREDDNHRQVYGRLKAGQAWQAVILNEYKIFEHMQKNEGGDLLVEILLDGSGSQSERQAQVAMQGYIIAQALSLCQIPCRVSAYATFLDYTIFRLYKDYDQTGQKNKNIFDYYGTGMNRDGFALRAVRTLLGQRPEANKILIVLSDGKPNDVRVFKKDAAKPKQKDYSGQVAVADTAMEVRKLRLEGISVLGVFNGLEVDLAAQQKIYGHDFAYIKNISQFSKIVGTYLKKELGRFI